MVLLDLAELEGLLFPKEPARKPRLDLEDYSSHITVHISIALRISTPHRETSEHSATPVCVMDCQALRNAVSTLLIRSKVWQMCDMGDETVEHVVLECVKYARDRNKMTQVVLRKLGNVRVEKTKGMSGVAAGTSCRHNGLQLMSSPEYPVTV
ncbi:hypothetical protein E2C01_007196 [Portunus trituberculatus]|uniref:Uncharacterized protein n=1 Tax=Portunus trituberculatus TaxID=210409 RepID=A0A5B7CZU7_PORTR|nr:hypothetical protein [Portunus trituberculatus]